MELKIILNCSRQDGGLSGGCPRVRQTLGRSTRLSPCPRPLHPATRLPGGLPLVGRAPAVADAPARTPAARRYRANRFRHPVARPRAALECRFLEPEAIS